MVAKVSSRLGKVALCSSDLAKGPEDDRVLAAKGGVAEVTELMVPADTKALQAGLAARRERHAGDGGRDVGQPDQEFGGVRVPDREPAPILPLQHGQTPAVPAEP